MTTDNTMSEQDYLVRIGCFLSPHPTLPLS